MTANGSLSNNPLRFTGTDLFQANLSPGCFFTVKSDIAGPNISESSKMGIGVIGKSYYKSVKSAEAKQKP